MSQGQVFKLERAVTHLRSGRTTREVAYGVTSLPPAEASPGALAAPHPPPWVMQKP